MDKREHGLIKRLNMKALILAGGRGSRMKNLSGEINKCLLKVNGKPLIEYSLENAACLDVEEIIVVVGYLAEQIINQYGIVYKDKRIKYVIQSDQKGLVHAIECAKEAIGEHDFMLFLGDEILIAPKHGEMLEAFRKDDIFGICGILKVNNISSISKTYNILQSGDRIHRLIEKPKHPQNNYMGTGDCIFRNELLSYIDSTPINQQRKQKELPDLIQCAIDEGKIVKSFNICRWYVNVNDNEELKMAEQRLSIN